jgi:hypothetical protein
MVNVTCCGNQDRATKASETHPNRPPNNTRNCYTRGDGGIAPFDWNQCGADDKACQGHGECDACKADSSGGYCDYKGQIYVARGGGFTKLEGSEIIDRSRSRRGSGREDLRVRRKERDLERKMENRVREMQIMGRDPFPSYKATPDTTSHEFVSDYMSNMGLGMGFFMIFVGLLIYMIENNLIKL